MDQMPLLAFTNQSVRRETAQPPVVDKNKSVVSYQTRQRNEQAGRSKSFSNSLEQARKSSSTDDDTVTKGCSSGGKKKNVSGHAGNSNDGIVYLVAGAKGENNSLTGEIAGMEAGAKTDTQAMAGNSATLGEVLQQLISLLQNMGTQTTDVSMGEADAAGQGSAEANQQLSELVKLISGENDRNAVMLNLANQLQQLLKGMVKTGELPKELGLETLSGQSLSQEASILTKDFLFRLSEALEKVSANLGQEKPTLEKVLAEMVKADFGHREAPVVTSDVKTEDLAKISLVQTAEESEKKKLQDRSTTSKAAADSSARTEGRDNALAEKDVKGAAQKLPSGPFVQAKAEAVEDVEANSFTGQRPEEQGKGNETKASFHNRIQPDPMTSQESGRFVENLNKAEVQINQLPKMTQSVFGQIIQKTKLVVLPGITEMQIQLKPEFLGKLNLSITTDNGVVTAKFHAESHQVKAIIEANLNTLRDALTEQGVKVDQLVVNVGTQRESSNFREQGKGFENYYSGKGDNNGVSSTNEFEKLFPGENVSNGLRDYYGNTVDFKA